METENKNVSDSDKIDALTTEEEAPQETPQEDPQEKPQEEPDTKPAEKPSEKPKPSEEGPSTEEPSLAEEALGLTEEPEPEDEELSGLKTEKTKLIDDITGLRGVRRDLRVQTQPPVETPKAAEKSPIELAAEQQEVPVDEVEVTGKLYRAQRAFEDRQTQAKEQQVRVNEYNEGVNNASFTMTDTALGKGLGIDALTQLGGHLLTTGDKMDLFNAGRNCGKEFCSRLKYRILEAGGPNAQELRSRLNAHKSQAKPKTEAKPKQTPKEKPASKPTNEEGPEVRASTEQILSELGLFE